MISQWQVGQTICIRDYTQEISLRIILRTIFGLDTGKMDDEASPPLGDRETSKKYDHLQKILVNYLDTLLQPMS